MYHSITAEPEPRVAPYYQVNTSPALFRLQMQYLADQGYQTLRLETLLASLSDPASHEVGSSPSELRCVPPHKPQHPPQVVITFDDGLRNFYTEAFPVLQEFGFTATMFLPTGFIGETPLAFQPSGSAGSSSSFSAGSTCLTWSDIRELHRHGIEFGSHTVTHPKLVRLPFEEIEQELQNSRTEIEQQLSARVSTFCFPYAFPQSNAAFVDRFTEILGRSGYTCCATTEIGRVKHMSNPFRLKRLPVNSLDDVPLLAAKLEGSYDWLNWPQSLAKRVKAIFATN